MFFFAAMVLNKVPLVMNGHYYTLNTCIGTLFTTNSISLTFPVLNVAFKVIFSSNGGNSNLYFFFQVYCIFLQIPNFFVKVTYQTKLSPCFGLV